MKKSATWFSRSLWLGILIDWLLGIPAIFAPEWTLRLLREQPASSPAWVAFTSMLLVLLSFFYLPIAAEPYRFPGAARLAVAARLAPALLFLWLKPWQYAVRGFLNLVLFVVQAPLLLLTEREAPRPVPPAQREPDPVRPADLYEYDGSTFAAVKEVVFQNPLTELPHYPATSLSDFLQLFNAAARNLADRRDIRPYFNKLIHTHGICYTGVWEIDRESEYTGYFAKGSRGLLLARVSVAGTGLRRGQRRSLGLAGKIFPTMDPAQKVKPANFVTVSHLSGSPDKHILDIKMTNAPSIGLSPAANLINRVIFRLMDTRPGIRLLHPISTLGVPPGGKVVTPDLMLLAAPREITRVSADDFRDELRLSNYGENRLIYAVHVKDFADQRWTRLGTITFTEDVISECGDKRLHFWIPSDLPSRN
jgi:hypothetical protein